MVKYHQLPGSNLHRQRPGMGSFLQAQVSPFSGHLSITLRPAFPLLSEDLSARWLKLEDLSRLTDPVNVTFLMRGWRQSASLNGGVFSKLVVKTLKTPLGNPACSARFAKARTDSGVSGDGFTSMQQPAAKAAEAFRKIILLQSATNTHLLNGRTHAIGKFQG